MADDTFTILLKQVGSTAIETANNVMGEQQKSGSSAIGQIAQTALGVASGMSIVVKAIEYIVGAFSNLTNLVGSLFKLLVEILRPISDIFITLIQPIFLLLKPIIVLVRQLFEPFKKIANDLMKIGFSQMKEGDNSGAMATFGSALGVLLSGLAPVLVGLSSEILKIMIDLLSSQTKLLVTAITTSIAYVVGLFSESGKNKVLEFGETINENIDKASDFAKDGLNWAVQSTQEAVLSMTIKAVDSYVNGLETPKNKINEGFTGLNTNVENNFNNLINKIRSKVNEISSISSSSSNNNLPSSSKAFIQTTPQSFDMNTQREAVQRTISRTSQLLDFSASRYDPFSAFR